MRLKIDELQHRFPSPWELYSLIVLVGAAIYIPTSYLVSAMPQIHSPLRFTGAACPFCGGTRAVTALFVGEFGLALKYNPLAILLLALFVWAAFSWLLMVMPFKRRVVLEATKTQRTFLYIMVGLAFAGNWVYVLWAGMYKMPLEL